MLSETTHNSVPPTAVKLKLETIRNTLEKKQSVIASLDEEIEDICDEKDVEKEIVERSEFEEELEGIICQLKSVLQYSKTQNDAADISRVKNNTVKVQLPKLSLTRFNGNPT